MAPDAPMPAQKFDLMRRLEREHWWFRAKRALVRESLADARADGRLAVDIGCGTGEVVRMLNDSGFQTVVGTDLSEYALRLAGSAVGDAGSVAVARAEALPFTTGAIACLTSLDVVEHLDDDAAALREYARVLAPGGVMVITVPAYMWAWSDHDVVLGHRRRYTRRSLLVVAQAAGLVVHRCTYFHSWLAPVAFLLRRTPLRRLVRSDAEEASFVSPAINRLLLLVVAVERAVARRVDLPFGLSLLLVASGPFLATATTAGVPASQQLPGTVQALHQPAES